MIDAEETRRQKARNLRYKKPIAKELNLNKITDDLLEIQEECENVRWLPLLHLQARCGIVEIADGRCSA